MATYSTPGVYVEEITKFPPSVAQVETAIPAFIGYTEKAKTSDKEETDDLNLVPTRISSLLEYEFHFGGAHPEKAIVVRIDDTKSGDNTIRTFKVPELEKKSNYLMYYTLQMFFANGGGPCYIISVDTYGNWTDPDNPPTIDNMKLTEGLDVLKKVDEPTLILFPEATNVADNDKYCTLYNAALGQCMDLQDRFTIMDTFDDSMASISDLRNLISSETDMNKYGAAYFPYLKTILNYQFNDSDIQVIHKSYTPGASILKAVSVLAGFEDPLVLPAKIESLVKTEGADPFLSGFINEVRALTPSATSDISTLTAADITNLKNSLKKLIDKLNEINEVKKKVNVEAKAAIKSLSEDTSGSLTAVESALGDFNIDFEGPNKLEEIAKNLDSIQSKFLKFKFPADETLADNLIDGDSGGTAIHLLGELNKLVLYTTTPAASYGSAPTITVDLLDAIVTNLTALRVAINASHGKDVDSGEFEGRFLSNIKTSDNGIYNQIKAEIAKRNVTLPPSGVVAGIYARIDKNNGVWKAPANVGLNYVSKPTINVSHEEQAGMNVHTTGKSVNAIRTFTGKGILVWGARTLAGNDNEWRYVSVRRFFNMVEESVKKASEQFVFEGNDANTWVRIRAMIENFLNLQWRAGALTGAKPEQAYYVRVGLGQTMTAEDILNGYMNIEIGMAVVRPAEFIVLKFSHKMQEA